MLVFVNNKDGKPLMPCSHRKARILLKEKKAKIIRYEPFTIQLLYVSSGYKQEITMGIDAGSKVIGISAVTDKKELLSAEIELRNDIVELLSTRRQNRRSRRNRKTRYRKPRFDNRKKPAGWLAPSIESKINAHIHMVELIHRLLPITKIIVEVASFDIQKIKNPDILGEEYQKGEQLGFWNVREYVLWRDNHQCKGRKDCKNKILNVHHIESRKTGGDAPNNLITLCEKCHEDYHKGLLDLKLKRGQSFKDAVFMGIMRWTFYNRLKKIYPNVSLTYGYITKNTRIQNEMPKEHRIDALCITGKPKVERQKESIRIKQVRKKKRSLHEETPRKGRKEPNREAKRNRKNTKEINHKGKTWCLWDKVQIEGRFGYISGFTGKMAYVQDIDGTYLQLSPKYKQVPADKLKLMERNNNWIYQEVAM